MRLGSSTSGATAYMEPAPLVALNNTEAALAEQEAEEEAAVLRRLSYMVRGALERRVAVRSHNCVTMGPGLGLIKWD